MQLTKENGIQAIMENTTVDPINNQGKPQGSGRKLLRSHQENKNLHTKMLDKPDIATKIDKYIQEQINNGNYDKIDIKEARKENQLHFVGYNFVVSSTSSSTKLKMTTDSSMHTWNFFRDCAIPFGDSTSGDYATCAKVATVKTFINKSPINLQSAVLQAVLEGTYIDDGGIEASFTNEISTLQDKILGMF